MKKTGITIEGKFGNAKRKGTLQRVMAKLAVTSRTVVTIGLIVLNLDTVLRFLCALTGHWHKWQGWMKAKSRTSPCYRPSLTWIRAPEPKMRTAA